MTAEKLKEKSDDFLVEKVQSGGDENCLKELINRHSGVYVHICQKYSSSMKNGIDDTLSNKDFIIYKCAETFDPSKNSKFSTWLANQARYYCLNSMRAEKVYENFDGDELDFFSSKNEDFTKEQEERERICRRIEDVKEVLKKVEDDNVRDLIMKKYFSEDGKEKTFTEITKHFGVSVQTLLNWHKKFLKIAKKELTKLEKSRE